ncbi:MAG: hypothetical protein EZS28_046126, partial [Streblomastix strix]
MSTLLYEPEYNSILGMPLQRITKKLGAECRIAQKVRHALVNNGYFVSDEYGFELYYEIYGTGERKILFINPSGGSLDDYRHIISKLVDNEEF